MALVIIGGIKRIGSVADKLVPAMLIVYFVFGIVVIFANVVRLPEIFWLIIKHAFTPMALAGGAAGYTVKIGMQMGFRRGLLTNEAGLGSAPIAHAAAQTPSPVHQGLMGIGEVCIDTLIICSITALINLSTGTWTSGLNGTAMTAAAFSKVVPVVGGLVVALSSLLFGYTTVIGWCYYGEQCMKYLFGLKVTMPYRIVYVVLCFVGAVISIEIVFYVGDIANALMALPNLFALLLLSGVVASTSKDFWAKYKRIEDFDQ